MRRNGADVVLAAHSVGPIETLAEEPSQCGARALAIPTDVADRDALQALKTRISAQFGEATRWLRCLRGWTRRTHRGIADESPSTF